MVNFLLKFIGFLAFVPMKLIAIFVRLKVHGAEHIPQGGYILCPTHMGDLDAYLIRRAFHNNPHFDKWNRYLYRLESGPWVRRLFLTWWGGWILESTGPNIGALRGALQWLEQEHPVTIFPEGYQPGESTFYHGAAFLACRSDKPLLPLVIDGGIFVAEGTPFYVFPLLVLWRHLRRARQVGLRFCEPLQPDVERYNHEGHRYLERLTKKLVKQMGKGEVH
jgi:1-acyl-sn-glycerol-3-phosphate acyltransferase